MKKPIQLKFCEFCGNPIPIDNVRATRYATKRFCNRQCSGAANRRPMPKKYCLYCHKELIPKEWDYPKNFAQRRYCDSVCALAHLWQDPVYRERTIRLVSIAQRKRCATPEFKAMQSRVSKELWQDPKYREKVTLAIIETFDNPEMRQELSERALNLWNRPGHKEHVRKTNSEITKALWQDPEYVAKTMRGQNVSPNKPEGQLLTILDNLGLGFKFTGDGSFHLAGKVPDFTNHKTRQIIEMYGIYWHTEDEAEKRTKLFSEHGFKTLIIWQPELADRDGLRDKILDFTIS